MDFSRFSLHIVFLDPTVGSEMKKTRPCVIVSPDSMNKIFSNVIIAPITSKTKNWKTRIDIELNGVPGQIALEQIRTVSKDRLVKKIGKLEIEHHYKISDILVEMFTF